VGSPGSGFALDPAEFDQLKKTLRHAGEELGLRDFTAKARLRGVTEQSVSQYENVEETVSDTILALTRFIERDYAQAVRAVQEFVNRTHGAIDVGIDAVHRAQLEYLRTENAVNESMNRLHNGG
jgi:hypothetical protein